MTITLTGNPISTQNIYRHRGNIVYMTREGKQLKESYQWQAKSQWKKKPIAKAVEVAIKLYFGDKRKRDIDNFFKVFFDSLNGIVWEDDKQIYKATVEKFVDVKNPRVEIMIV